MHSEQERKFEPMKRIKVIYYLILFWLYLTLYLILYLLYLNVLPVVMKTSTAGSNPTDVNAAMEMLYSDDGVSCSILSYLL